MTSDNHGRLAGLDMLRGVAALSVLWFHFTWQAHHWDASLPVFELGARGVEVFFTISGYVILMTAQRAESRGAFLIARGIRLYPAFLICMSMTTAWVLAWQLRAFMISPAEWLANLTMLPRLFGASYVEAPYWSLSFEVAFYGLVALFLPWIRRGRALELCAAYLALTPFLPAWVESASLFCVGVGIFELERRPIMSMAIAAAALTIGHQLDSSVIAPALVLIALRLPCPAGVAGLAGGASYPLYLLHYTIGGSLLAIGGPNYPSLLLAAATIIVLSMVVDRFVDRPTRAALTRRLLSPHVPMPSETAVCAAPVGVTVAGCMNISVVQSWLNRTKE